MEITNRFRKGLIGLSMLACSVLGVTGASYNSERTTASDVIAKAERGESFSFVNDVSNFYDVKNQVEKIGKGLEDGVLDENEIGRFGRFRYAGSDIEPIREDDVYFKGMAYLGILADAYLDEQNYVNKNIKGLEKKAEILKRGEVFEKIENRVNDYENYLKSLKEKGWLYSRAEEVARKCTEEDCIVFPIVAGFMGFVVPLGACLLPKKNKD